jgi:hypothetical protein
VIEKKPKKHTTPIDMEKYIRLCKESKGEVNPFKSDDKKGREVKG